MKVIYTILLSFFLVSCGAMPKYANQTTSVEPTISVIGAPIGSVIYVNDKPVGSVDEKNNVFKSQTGTHRVVIRGLAGEILFDQIVYFTRNIEKKIDLR